MTLLNLGFLASHGGSNMQAIVDWCKDGRLYAKPCAVISNNSNSFALQRAKNEGIPAYHISNVTYPNQEDFDNAIIKIFTDNCVDTIILAGYMKILSPRVIEYFNGRVLNIHPALLPKYGGKGMYGKFVHEAVIASKEEFSGPTVHLVNSEYDKGRILAQIKIPVLPNDTSESLAARVLEQEHIIYPQTLQKIALGEIIL